MQQLNEINFLFSVCAEGKNANRNLFTAKANFQPTCRSLATGISRSKRNQRAGELKWKQKCIQQRTALHKCSDMFRHLVRVHFDFGKAVEGGECRGCLTNKLNSI